LQCLPFTSSLVQLSFYPMPNKEGTLQYCIQRLFSVFVLWDRTARYSRGSRNANLVVTSEKHTISLLSHFAKRTLTRKCRCKHHHNVFSNIKEATFHSINMSHQFLSTRHRQRPKLSTVSLFIYWPAVCCYRLLPY
jgi:hypothetical protein